MNTQPKILRSIRNLPKFEYAVVEKIFYINQTTSLDCINDLIHQVKEVKQFILVTKYDFALNHACFITNLIFTTFANVYYSH